MENCRITCDKTGWEFRIDNVPVVGVVDSGSNDADFEVFTRALGDLENHTPNWFVSFPEKYRGQNGHYTEGVRFMSVKRPDGRVTSIEFIYRRLPWKFVRSVEHRYEEKQEGELRVPPDPPQSQDLQGSRRNPRQRKGKGRTRRNQKVA